MPGYMTDKITVTLDTATSTTKVLDIGSFSYGSIEIPSGSSITVLTYEVSSDGVTWYPAYDGATAQTQTVQADRAYRITSNIFCHKWVAILVDVQGEVNISLGY